MCFLIDFFLGQFPKDIWDEFSKTVTQEFLKEFSEFFFFLKKQFLLEILDLQGIHEKILEVCCDLGCDRTSEKVSTATPNLTLEGIIKAIFDRNLGKNSSWHSWIFTWSILKHPEEFLVNILYKNLGNFLKEPLEEIFEKLQ